MQSCAEDYRLRHDENSFILTNLNYRYYNLNMSHSDPFELFDSPNTVDPPISWALGAAPIGAAGASAEQAPEFSPTKNVSSGGQLEATVVASLVSPATVTAVVGLTRGDHSDLSAQPQAAHGPRRWYRWPDWLFIRTLDLSSLLILLAIVAAVPVIQLASLGYLLHAASNLAVGRPWSAALPGLRMSGRLGIFFFLAGLTWLPVYLVTDLAYTAQLLQPGSPTARVWRLGAFIITFIWVLHFAWAAMRGGRWWQVLWPDPLGFLSQIWRLRTWRRASDNLYETVQALHFPGLWWLGARAAAISLALLLVPVSLMIIGLRATGNGFGLVGFVGFMGMLVVILYLPFSQIQLAAENRLLAALDWRRVRRRFLHAPLAHAFALLALCLLSLPLYLLRIEEILVEFQWLPSLVFVGFMFPAKLVLGAAMGYAAKRSGVLARPPRSWYLRWPARLLALASALIYVGSLYAAQLVAGQGALVMFFQHAFLVPTPF